MPWNAAHREPVAAARAGLCRSPRRKKNHTRGGERSVVHARRRRQRAGRSGPQPDGGVARQVRRRPGGGAVGGGTVAAALSEEEDAIEEMYEPYLMQIGMIDRTPRGRVATQRAYEYFGRELPRRQPRLF